MAEWNSWCTHTHTLSTTSLFRRSWLPLRINLPVKASVACRCWGRSIKKKKKKRAVSEIGCSPHYKMLMRNQTIYTDYLVNLQNGNLPPQFSSTLVRCQVCSLVPEAQITFFFSTSGSVQLTSNQKALTAGEIITIDNWCRRWRRLGFTPEWEWGLAGISYYIYFQGS